MDENTDRDNINSHHYDRSTYANSYDIKITYGVGLSLFKLLGVPDRIVKYGGSFNDARLYRRDRVEKFIEDHQLEWERQRESPKSGSDRELVSVMSYAYTVNIIFMCKHEVSKPSGTISVENLCPCIMRYIGSLDPVNRLFVLREFYTNYPAAISSIDTRKRGAKYARDIIKKRFNERCHEALVKLEDKNGNK